MSWWQLTRRAEEWREEAREHIGDPRSYRIAVAAVLTSLFVTIALGIYWSREPVQFVVTDAARSLMPKQTAPFASGSTTTATLIKVLETLLDKPGGLLANDIAPPGGWLDNMPSWEYGALMQARDLTRVLRESTSRSQLNSVAETITLSEDEALGRAGPRLNFSHKSWTLPSSESQYRDAIDYLRDYLARLQQTNDERAIFDASSTNLDLWLDKVATRLGNLSQRLSACVRPQENPLLRSSVTAVDIPLTPAGKIDDVFFEARGSTWALLHFLRAAEIDYATVLTQRNALPLLREAIRDLEQAQTPVYAPLILNGGGFGLLANHSLVMASYTARAHAAVNDLRSTLVQTNLTQPAQNY